VPADDELTLRVSSPRPTEVQASAAAEGDASFEVLDDAMESPAASEGTVRGLLAGFGNVLSTAAGDADVPDHWRFTDQELDDLTPPITRIVNRRPQLRRAIEHGDEVTVALHLAAYAGRNVDLARAAKEARSDDIDREAGGPQGAPGPRARADAGLGGHDGQDGDGLHSPAGGVLG
jgi:hypothetical protein